MARNAVIATPQRRFLVVLLGSEHVEPCEPWVRALLERGHRVNLAVITAEKSLRGPAQRLVEEGTGLVLQRAPKPQARDVANLRRGLLGLADLARHQHPEGRWARARAAARLPASRRRDGPLPTDASRAYRQTLGRISHPAYAHGASRRLLGLGLGLEPDARLVEWMSGQEADVVALSPLVTVGSIEAEYALAARAAGLSTALVVAGASDLSAHGFIKGHVDFVVAWNDLQCRDAMAVHGLPRSRIAVLGSATFDPWYTAQPSRSAGELRSAAGLAADRPYALLRSSAEVPAPYELAVVRDVAAGLEAREPRLELLVHPDARDRARWEHAPGVTVWPREPQTEGTGALLDAMWHSTAVVSLEPTALFEAAVLRRPIFAFGAGVRNDETRALTTECGGPIRVVADVETLVSALRSDMLEARDGAANIDAFIRPLGQGIPVAPMIADALERLPGRRLPSPPEDHAHPRMARTSALAAKLSASGSPGWSPFLLERGRGSLSRVLRPRRAPVPAAVGGSEQTEAGRAAARPGAGTKRLAVYGPWQGDVTAELLYWLPWLRTACDELGSADEVVVLHGGRDARWYRSLDVQVLDAHALGASGKSVKASLEKRHPDTVLVKFADTQQLENLIAAYREGTRGMTSVLRWGSFRRLLSPDGPDREAITVIAGGHGDPSKTRAGIAGKISDAAAVLLSGAHPAVDLVECGGWSDLTDWLLPSDVACVTTMEVAALAVCLGVDTILMSDGLTPAGEADFDVLDRVAATLGVELTRIAKSGARLLAGNRGVSLTDSSA